MLLVNVHELDVVLADPIIVGTLEDKIDNIRRIFSFECEHIRALGGLQDFREGGKVDSKSDVAVASVRGERLGLQHHGDEGDVRVIHSLKGDSGVIAIEIAVLYKVLDGIDNLGRGQLLFS